VARAASQRLCPFEVNASRCMGVKIKPTNVRQDFLIFMANCEWVRVRNSLSCPSYGDAEFVRVALEAKGQAVAKELHGARPEVAAKLRDKIVATVLFEKEVA
jgi:hypothetical protein